MVNDSDIRASNIQLTDKNNDFIKQIFYEQKNIFTLHNYLIRTPCH